MDTHHRIHLVLTLMHSGMHQHHGRQREARGVKHDSARRVHDGKVVSHGAEGQMYDLVLVWQGRP